MDTTTIPATTTRLQRGVRLFLERGQEIDRTTAHTDRVPSCSGEGFYLVWTDMRACTCPDHRTAKAAGERCKHVVAAEIVLAKRRAARRRRDAS
jgi:bifunctional pyridoxal-dependent enzyme with beta-cystathionase and maltose regulon repressor activities